MNRARLLSRLLVLCLPFGTIASALAESRELRLAEARALALKTSPLVSTIDGEFAVRLAEAAELNQRENPEIEASLGVPVAWDERRGDNEYEIKLSQPVRLSDFGERYAVGDLMRSAASAEQRSALFKLLKEVDLAYVTLWMAQQHAVALGGAGRAARARAKVIADGASRGVYSDGDKQLFLAEAARLEAELLGADGDVRSATAKLVALLGAPLVGVQLQSPKKMDRLVLEEVKAAERKSQLSEAFRSKLHTELAAEQLRLARRDAFPTLTPQLMASRSDDGTSFIGVGLSLPLPVFHRNEAQITHREAELRAVRAKEAHLAGEGFAAEIAAMVEAVNLASDEASLFDAKVIPAFSDSLRIQERQFAAGSGSILQIWQTQRELFESQRRSLELWTKAHSLRIELETLIGEELQP